MKDILEFINKSPNAFAATNNISEILKENDYLELKEDEVFKLEKGKKYFVRRNDSSVIAFNIGKKLDNPSLQICASHTDCPSFKLKPEALLYENGYLKLNTEIYGGPIYYPWLDRPLSIAGRLIVSDEDGLESIIYDENKPFCIIPSVAIHMNREVNKALELKVNVDLLPIVSLDKFDLIEYLSKKVNKKVIAYDLYLYPFEKGYIWGINVEFISSYHIDNLECAYTSLKAFINNFNDENINVYACFDNEEVGSLTRQGADSNFFESILKRIFKELDLDYYMMLSRGICLSCDNGHGLHPNHPELADKNNRPLLNKGIVIKYNANQSYTTDALSLAILKDLFDNNGIAYQYYTNRSDLKGGSTLGNISNAHVSIKTIDIGLAQLAMHSPLETAGSKDIKTMIDGLTLFYKAHLRNNKLEI